MNPCPVSFQKSNWLSASKYKGLISIKPAIFLFRSGSDLDEIDPLRVSASSDSLANRGPSPRTSAGVPDTRAIFACGGVEAWVSEANQQTFIAAAMNPRLRQWVL